MDEFELVLKNGVLTLRLMSNGQSTSYKLPDRPGPKDSMKIFYHFKSFFEPMVGEERFRKLDNVIDEIIERNFTWKNDHTGVDYKDARMTKKLAAQEESVDDKARRFVDEGLVLSMGEARRYAVAGVTPERLREMRKSRSQPLRMRRDYGERKASSGVEDTYVISEDKASGWGPESVTLYSFEGLPVHTFEGETKVDPDRHLEPVKREARRKGRELKVMWHKGGKEWSVDLDGRISGPFRIKEAHYDMDDLAFIDVSAGGNFEVKLPGKPGMKAGTSNDAYALVQKFAEKNRKPLKVIDVPRGSTRSVDAHGNIFDGRQAMRENDEFGTSSTGRRKNWPKRLPDETLEEYAERVHGDDEMKTVDYDPVTGERKLKGYGWTGGRSAAINTSANAAPGYYSGDKTSPFGDWIVKHIEEDIIEREKQAEKVKKLVKTLAALLDDCYVLSMKKYPEGSDYHGNDFFSQTFPRETLQKLKDYQIGIFDMDITLQNLIQKYKKERSELVDDLSDSAGDVQKGNNWSDDRNAFVRNLDTIADRLEMHGMREAAEKLDVVSNTLEATNWGASPYQGAPWSNEPWGKDPIKAMDNFHKALELLGWQGGTIHQVAKELGINVQDIQETDDIEGLVRESVGEKEMKDKKGA